MTDGNKALFVTVVLDRLFEFLDIKTLKMCRLVCRAWNLSGSRSLSKQCSICIYNVGRMDDYKEMTPSRNNPSLIFKNFKILETNVNNGREGKEGQLMVRELITHCGSSIRSLEIVNIMEPAGIHPSLAEALASLPLLEELKLAPPYSNFSNCSCNFNKFPRLKALSIRFGSDDSYYFDDPVNPNILIKYFSSLIKACHLTLQKLSIDSYEFAFNNEVLHLLETGVDLKGLLHLVLEYRISNVNTRSLGRMLAGLPKLDRFECCFSKKLIYREVSEILANLKQARHIAITTTCKLFDFNFSTQVQFTNLPYMPQLESLILYLRISGDAGALADCFPNIQRLECVINHSEEWKKMECLKELTVSWNFPIKPEAFSITQANFPALTKLTLRFCKGMGKLIFGKLHNLTELVAAPGSSVCDEDITGIEPASLEIIKSTGVTIIRTRPYIGDLKHLRFLYLPSVYVTNDSIRFGITDLNSLTHLTLVVATAKVKASLATTPSASALENVIHLGTRYKLDLEPLMYPRLPYLVQLTVLHNRYRKRKPEPVVLDNHVSRMKTSRTQFSYSEITDSNSFAIFSQKYKVFEHTRFL